MNRRLHILVIHSGRDLFKYKSFLLLVFALVLADRLIQKVLPQQRSPVRAETLLQLGEQAAAYVFTALPVEVLALLTDYRTFLVLGLLFLFKQIISLWPSSDMRRMHRREREAFGLLGSLLAIRREQVVWDAAAVGTTCTVAGVWLLAAFEICRQLWHLHGTVYWLLLLALLGAAALPVIMAGFSYSSKLAVLARGRFRQKLALFLRLFWDPRVFVPSWLFFLVRILIEALFVVTIPAAILYYMESFWMRVLLASLVATPVYSYLKMASFKFFLQVYGRFDLVQQEYAGYYTTEGNQ